MRRREFIAGLGSAAAWPVVALGQQPAVPVIGVLHSGSFGTSRDTMAAFHRGLSETGFVEGRNVAIEYRSADNKYDTLPALATDLVRRQVTVIATFGTTLSAIAAKAVTTTIPIVFSIGADPVNFGLVASLNRPGGNATGVTFLTSLLAAKQFELLRELLPTAPAIAILVNPTNPYTVSGTDAQRVARTLAQKVYVLNASTEGEIDAAFATLVRQRAGGLYVPGDALFYARREQIIALAARHAIPTIYAQRDFVDIGGLMSYGASVADANRLVGGYVGRILKGEKPADLPVQQVTKIELAINLKTAKALGLTIPETLLATADEVIQ